MSNYDTWRSTEPSQSGECCRSCKRREAVYSDGLCEECARDERELSESEAMDAAAQAMSEAMRKALGVKSDAA